jgi:hypothetical protein
MSRIVGKNCRQVQLQEIEHGEGLYARDANGALIPDVWTESRIQELQRILILF